MPIEGTVVKTKTNFFEGLNKLNAVIVKPVLDVEILEGIIDKYKISQSFLIRKLYTHIYNYPWIITYLNKYMNYLGIMSSDLIEFIKSYRYVLSTNGVLDSRRFYFMKMTACRDELQEKIIDLLDRYFSERFNEHFNYKELLFYYNLYINGIITNQDIHEIDLYLNNNIKTINLPNFTPDNPKEKSISVDKIIKQYRETSRGIDLINNEIYKKRLECCGSCQYSGREVVPFDGNIKDINDVDVLIVNLNPDLNDLREKRTFREKTIIRQNISLFPKEIKWLLINLIPCVFRSKSEIGKDIDEIKDQLSKCSQIVLDFINKNINPKFTILIGQETTSAFLPAAEFEETLGVLTEGKYISVLHPNSMKQAKAQLRGKKYWENVQKLILDSIEQPKTAAVKEEEKPAQIEDLPKPAAEVPLEKIKKKDKLLLLDVKEIEDGKTVLMIFTDEDGNKHYQTKRNVTTGYIKESSFKNCGILTDSVDYEFSMTKSEKFKLIKLLRDKMAKLKGN